MIKTPFINTFMGRNSVSDIPNATPGVTVTTSASVDTKGSYAVLHTAAEVASDVAMIELYIYNGSTSAAVRRMKYDIGVDPAGGTSYTNVIADLFTEAGTAFLNGVSNRFMFPLKIPAGAQIAARAACIDAGSVASQIDSHIFMRPTRPELVKAGAYSEIVGGASATAFTPGNAVFGSWVSLGTTVKHLWWFQAGFAVNNTVQSAHMTRVQIAAGNGTVFAPPVIDGWFQTNTTEQGFNWSNFVGCSQHIPAGSTLYVRGNNSAAPVSGYFAQVQGIGG